MEEYKFLGTANSLKSSRIVVDVLEELIHWPQSIMDIGCGVGGWSLPFKEKGTERIFMVDHPSNSKSNLLLTGDEFYSVDLNTELPPDFKVDMVICLEVLEHIKPENGQRLVAYMTNISDTILFSAAIPRQGGIDHINEQRSAYWKDMFKVYGFERFDIIRPHIIHNKEIEYYFRQNLFLFSKDKSLFKNDYDPIWVPDDFELINVYILNKRLSPLELLRLFPDSLIRSVKNRLKLK